MHAKAPQLLVALVFILMAGCQPAETFTQADLDAAVAEVQAELDGFWAAWSAASFDEGMAYYSDEPEMTLATNGILWESKAVVEENFRSLFEAMDRQDVDLTDTRILALTPGIVYVTQAGTYTVVDQSGEVSPVRTYTGSLLWVKEGGDWTIVGYHGSEAAPPPASMNSVHLLNAPSAADEAAYAAGVRELNMAIREAGYPGNGYDLWKMGDQNPEYESVGAGLILEGKWTDQETYDLVHALDAYNNIPPETLEMFQRVAEGQRYTRYMRVPVGGPGEG
jgi:hypothetical protein